MLILFFLILISIFLSLSDFSTHGAFVDTVSLFQGEHLRTCLYEWENIGPMPPGMYACPYHQHRQMLLRYCWQSFSIQGTQTWSEVQNSQFYHGVAAVNIPDRFRICIQSTIKVLGKKANYFVFAIPWRHLGLGSKDEYEISVLMSSYLYLDMLNSLVKWHLW